jgi:hypothetical protein
MFWEMGWEAPGGGGGVNFMLYPKWQWPMERFSQIRLQAKYENNLKKTFIYFLATYLTMYKNLDFFLKF